MTKIDETTEDSNSRKTTSDRYLIIRRGLYFRPDGCGYTGIKSQAGRYPLAIAEEYKGGGCNHAHEDDCPDYSPACFEDLKAADLKRQIESLRQTVLDDHQKLNEARGDIEQKDRQIGLLISEIWSLSVKLGIANPDVTPDGPQALLLMEGIQAAFNQQQSEIERWKSAYDIAHKQATENGVAAAEWQETCEDSQKYAHAIIAELKAENQRLKDSEQYTAGD